MKFAPDKITALAPDEVFVFASSHSGKHRSGGAAQYATQYLGARYGVGEGLTGQCYALPTKDHAAEVLSLALIRVHVKRFLECARANHGKIFLVTEHGAGFAAIAPLFLEDDLPENVRLPRKFMEVVK